MKFLAHVDADCFYVSCERIRDARLMNRPVAVLGNQGACVIAMSYEMKAAGVDVAMPIWMAKKICPEAIFIKRDFRWYGLLSRAMQDVLNEYTDHIEYYSIDESFLDLGEVPGDPTALARRIQSHMLNATGLPVSVGLGPTRTLCKLAAKVKKPFGTLVLTEDNREAVLSQTPISKVNGIGRRLIHRVHKHGIHTALDYARMPRREIRSIFHKPGEALWYELRGVPVYPIQTERVQRKVVSRGGSIWGHYTDPKIIWGFLVRNLERFCTELWSNELEVARITVVLRMSEGGSHQATIVLPDYNNEHGLLLGAMRTAFQKAFRPGHRYCRVHIVGEPVRPYAGKQMNLFTEEDGEARVIRQLKAQLNQRFGLFTLRNASSQMAGEVFKDKVSDFEITDVPDKHLF